MQSNKKYDIEIRCKTEKLRELFCQCSDITKASSITDTNVVFKNAEMFMPIVIYGYKEDIMSEDNGINNFELYIKCKDKLDADIICKMIESVNVEYHGTSVTINRKTDDTIIVLFKGNDNYFPKILFSYC